MHQQMKETPNFIKNLKNFTEQSRNKVGTGCLMYLFTQFRNNAIFKKKNESTNHAAPNFLNDCDVLSIQ
jgi:hypothetical protein